MIILNSLALIVGWWEQETQEGLAINFHTCACNGAYSHSSSNKKRVPCPLCFLLFIGTGCEVVKS